jgi:hypothetical protein
MESHIVVDHIVMGLVTVALRWGIYLFLDLSLVYIAAGGGLWGLLSSLLVYFGSLDRIPQL